MFYEESNCLLQASARGHLSRCECHLQVVSPDPPILLRACLNYPFLPTVKRVFSGTTRVAIPQANLEAVLIGSSLATLTRSPSLTDLHMGYLLSLLPLPVVLVCSTCGFTVALMESRS
jgi:hypothetical protein